MNFDSDMDTQSGRLDREVRAPGRGFHLFWSHHLLRLMTCNCRGCQKAIGVPVSGVPSISLPGLDNVHRPVNTELTKLRICLYVLVYMAENANWYDS